ncbi:hypothetical protein EEB14_56660, partial [Rhodococcus sp. WS4]
RTPSTPAPPSPCATAPNPTGDRTSIPAPCQESWTRGRLVAVVGATGERDPGKRAPLGATAACFADTVIVTDESPYSEDAGRLREDVARGARAGGDAEVLVVSDRSEAILTAVGLAGPGDVVVVAGRGHDPVQEYGGHQRVFDDRVALREALLRLAAP